MVVKEVILWSGLSSVQADTVFQSGPTWRTHELTHSLEPLCMAKNLRIKPKIVDQQWKQAKHSLHLVSEASSLVISDRENTCGMTFKKADPPRSGLTTPFGCQLIRFTWYCDPFLYSTIYCTKSCHKMPLKYCTTTKYLQKLKDNVSFVHYEKWKT